MSLDLVVLQVLVLVDETPDPTDVKAGWTAFLVFLLLIAAVVVLAFSLVKHLRRADSAEEAGLYDPSDKKQRPRPDVSP